MADVAGPLIPIILHLLDFYGFKIRVGTLVYLQNRSPKCVALSTGYRKRQKSSLLDTKRRFF